MSRAISLLLAPLAALVLLLPACGGGADAPAREEGPFGAGANEYWLYRPDGKPRALVVFLHGLSRASLDPKPHRPWLEHLAEQGNAVLYPRYELSPGARGALGRILVAVQAGVERLRSPFVPTVVIGYSRGGRLAVGYAAVAEAIGRVPAGVMSVFPGLLNPAAEEVVDFRSIDRRTAIRLLVGDRDRTGQQGATELLVRLRAASIPQRNVRLLVIRSRDGFEATHGAPLETSEGARREFWERADRLIDQVVRGR